MLVSETTGDLIETESDEKGIRIRALLGRPSLSRTSNQFQYTFLNGRFIRDKFISHAIKEAYRGMLDANRFPVVFLFIEMPFSEYDVNVHPTKIEVRFYNANLVHSQVLGVLREQLLGTDLNMPAQLPTRESAAGRRGRRRPGSCGGSRSPMRWPSSSRGTGPPSSSSSSTCGRRALRDRRGLGLQQNRARQARPAAAHPAARGPRYLQIHDSYIVEQTEDGFVIIDQHALHERMLYETLQRRLQRDSLESQRLLLPESFEVTRRRRERSRATPTCWRNWASS